MFRNGEWERFDSVTIPLSACAPSGVSVGDAIIAAMGFDDVNTEVGSGFICKADVIIHIF